MNNSESRKRRQNVKISWCKKQGNYQELLYLFSASFYWIISKDHYTRISFIINFFQQHAIQICEMQNKIITHTYFNQNFGNFKVFRISSYQTTYISIYLSIYLFIKKSFQPYKIFGCYRFCQFKMALAGYPPGLALFIQDILCQFRTLNHSCT